MDAEKMAREVAKELRKRGIWAVQYDKSIAMPRLKFVDGTHRAVINYYAATNPDFAGMTALEIADEIQTREVRRAQEWAGDT